MSTRKKTISTDSNVDNGIIMEADFFGGLMLSTSTNDKNTGQFNNCTSTIGYCTSYETHATQMVYWSNTTSATTCLN